MLLVYFLTYSGARFRDEEDQFIVALVHMFAVPAMTLGFGALVAILSGAA